MRRQRRFPCDLALCVTVTKNQTAGMRPTLIRCGYMFVQWRSWLALNLNLIKSISFCDVGFVLFRLGFEKAATKVFVAFCDFDATCISFHACEVKVGRF